MIRRGEPLSPRALPPISGGADGLFYQDMREPFFGADIAAVTILTTATALYVPAQFPPLGPNYFNRVGKMLKIRLWVKYVTGLTPGNVSWNVHWGTGANANGTLIMTAGTPVAATASVTKAYFLEVMVRCLTAGATGTLEATGFVIADPGIIASTLQPIMLPTAGAAASAALDLTAANIVSVQALQSGTAGCTMQIQQMEVVACN